VARLPSSRMTVSGAFTFRGVHGLESGIDARRISVTLATEWRPRIGRLASTCPARGQSHALQRSQVKCFRGTGPAVQSVLVRGLFSNSRTSQKQYLGTTRQTDGRIPNRRNCRYLTIRNKLCHLRMLWKRSRRWLSAKRRLVVTTPSTRASVRPNCDGK
jgi:hypothetical protein